MARKPGVTSEETKARLIEAAAEVFAERGYEGARLADIAEAAGLSTGAIYAHYANKAELLLTAIAARSAGAVETTVGGDRKSVLDTLARSGSNLNRGSDESLLLLEGVVAGRRDPELAAVLREHLELRQSQLAERVRAEQADGTVRRNTRADAVAHLSVLLGLGSLVARALELEAPSDDDWSAVIGGMVDSIRRVDPAGRTSAETSAGRSHDRSPERTAEPAA